MTPGTLPIAPFIVVLIVGLVLATFAEAARYFGMRKLAAVCHLLTILLCLGTAALTIYIAQGAP